MLKLLITLFLLLPGCVTVRYVPIPPPAPQITSAPMPVASGQIVSIVFTNTGGLPPPGGRSSLSVMTIDQARVVWDMTDEYGMTRQKDRRLSQSEYWEICDFIVNRNYFYSAAEYNDRNVCDLGQTVIAVRYRDIDSLQDRVKDVKITGHVESNDDMKVIVAELYQRRHQWFGEW